ncbi:hypothetical protein ACCC92_10850 [Mucilaginibacter sp. Mucisp84]|uniref:hypothetical protein n=1 Tax=Mucilaginibacter sp. Mucisp84 TaxID=3243058 RepID=UPI0039A68140
MRDFSLDQNAERIHSPKTKTYFDEVLKSYYNESYRSAIVMLYSITIADLLYKLEELKDLYNDAAAIDILNEVSTTQNNSVKLSEWEGKLVELVSSRTSLFDAADYIHFKALQNLRNLCAHPVLDGNYELYAPNRETTRAHIRNMMEGILIKPALLSKKIFDDFLENLVAVQHFFPDPAQLEKHLQSKYLERFSDKVKSQIFRSLWKVALKLKDEKSVQHRFVTNRALSIMLKLDYGLLVRKISEEKEYFSDIDPDLTYYLLDLFNQFPKVSEMMNETTKMIINNQLGKNADLDALAYYRELSIEAHMERVSKINYLSNYEYSYISTPTLLKIYNQALLQAKRVEGNIFLIKMFGSSPGYDTADKRFSDLIEPLLDEFDLNELKLLVEAVNGNSQVYGRRRARTDNQYIKDRVLELEPTFSFGSYQNFN